MSVPQVAVTSMPLDSGSLVALVDKKGDGAVVSFAGLVRDHNQGRQVKFLEYEAYEPLAIRALQRIVARHGVYVWGDDLMQARHRLECLEWLLRFKVETRDIFTGRNS